MRGSAIAVFSIFVASPAIAATLGVPTQGYTYFHRAGADSIAHNAAIETCAANAASLLPPAIANTGGALGSLIDSIERDKVAKVNFAANLENCMTIKGWDVVRLDDSEGKSIANLEAPALSTVLAPWIGAETVHGQIVRQYQPIGNMPVTAADIFDSAGSSLSLASDLGGVNRAVAAVPERVNRPPWQVPEAEDDLSKISAGATLIVVRATTIAPAQASLEFAYLDKPEERNPMSADSAFIVPTPTRFFWTHGAFLEKIYVFVVRPGHWRIAAMNGVSLCLGGPAFDVGPGEAIFAGNFSATDPHALNLDPAAAKAMLGNVEFVQRLKPAQYINGETHGCGHVPATFLYKIELKETRFSDDRGSKAEPAPQNEPSPQ
jgi:hypothetical protein